MAETLKDLYNKLERGNIQLPDYNTFEQKYSKEGGAEDLYAKLNAGNIQLPSINDFKAKYFTEPYSPPKEPAGFFEGLTSQFRDLFGTKADQSKAYLEALRKSKPATQPGPLKTDWDVYNDLTNLLKPVNKNLTPDDYITTDNYLKSLNISTRGQADSQDNPFQFEYGTIGTPDSHLRVKDDIEEVRKRKVGEIRKIYEDKINALDKNPLEYAYEKTQSFLGFDNDISRLEKERDKKIKEVEDQFDSYVSNILDPQLVTDKSLVKTENLGIAQVNKNIVTDPITGRQYFDAKNAAQDINKSTLGIKQQISAFDKDLEAGPSSFVNPETGEMTNQGSKMYDFLGMYGIDLQYNRDNKSRDIAMSNFNYGNISSAKNIFGFDLAKTSNIERDGYVFNGLKAQVQVIDKQIEESQKQIERFSALAETGKGQQRKENVDFINSLNQNVIALKQLKQKITDWGDVNLEDYKKYLASQKELKRLSDQVPLATDLSNFVSKGIIGLVPGLIEVGERIAVPLSERSKQQKLVQPGSTRTVSMGETFLKQLETPTLENIEPTILQKGIEVPISEAETFSKPENVSGLNPFNYTISARPFFYNSVIGIRDMFLMGGIGGAIEKGLSSAGGKAIMLATESAAKREVAWNLEKQIAKNIAAARVAEEAGSSVLKYNLANTALGATKFGNRVVAMTVPTAAIYGNDINKEFLNAGFSPDEALKLSALSVLFESGSEAIFGNEIRLYNALVDGTSDAALKATANNALERAFRDRAKNVLSKELTQGELGTLKKFWVNLQKFKNSKGVSSVLEGIKTFGGGTFKTFGEESLEEISTNLGNAIFTTPLGRAYNPEYQGEDFSLENQVATVMNTVATMLPMGFASGYTNYRDFKKNERIEGLQAKYEVGLNPGVHIGILNESFNNGEISKDEYEKRVALVKKYGEYGVRSTLESNKVSAEKGYNVSEADNHRFNLFETYLKKDKLETLFTQALTDEDKAGFVELIAKQDEQIIKYITNGLYENEEDRRKANISSLNYLFNDATVKAYKNENRLEAVMDQLVVQSLIEKDPELVKMYESKINLLNNRKQEIIQKKKEDEKSLTEKANENNAKGSITVPGLLLGDIKLDYNKPYYYTPNQKVKTEDGQEIFATKKISILKDNGDGTVQVLVDDFEEKSLPIEMLGKSEMIAEEEVENWKKSNSPKAIVFEHRNDLFSFEFDKPSKSRERIVSGRIVYNALRNGIDFIYKTIDGKTAVKELSRKEVKELNKGRLKYLRSYETAEEFYKKTKKLEEQAEKVSFEESLIEPFKKWEFIIDFIERKTEELNNTKELIKKVQEKLNTAKKTLNDFVDTIDNKKSVDVQNAINIANDLKEQVAELEWNLQILEEQKQDIEDQIEYTKKYDRPDFQEGKTLVDELIDDQFNLELQLEKVNDVIGSLKEMIDNITDFINKTLEFVDGIYQKAKTLYPKIPLESEKWVEFVRQNPNIMELKPEFAKDLSAFNTVINENLEQIDVKDREVENLRKSLSANIELAKDIQSKIRFQQDLIEEARKNQERLKERAVEKKIKDIANEIFKNQENNQSSSQTNFPDEDVKLVKEESQKIPLELFFSTATSGTTQEDGLNLEDPNVLKLQNFSNNIQNPEEFSFIVVTADNAAEFGMQDAIYKDDKITNQGDDESKYDIKLLIVDKKTQNPVDQNGKETSNPAQYVFTSLRQARTSWKNGEKAYFTRKGKEQEDEKIAKLYEEKHKEFRAELIRETKKGNKQKLDIKYVSRGRKVNEGQQNSVVGTLIPEDFDLTNQKIITVPLPSETDSKTGKIPYGNGNVLINMPIGRAVVNFGNSFEFAYNRKFNKKDIDKFVKLFKALYDAYKASDIVKVNTILEYLSHVLYLRDPYSSTTYKKDQETKIGRSQIFIKNIDGQPYLYLGSEGGRIPFNFEKENINSFFSLYAFFTGKDGKGIYHNIDYKKDGQNMTGKPFVEITGVNENGTLTTRKWSSYQEYLLSKKLPDGSIRPVEEIPLTVKINPSVPTTPNRAGRYLVYENPYNQEVTDSNPRSTIVEKTTKGKDSKKGNVNKATAGPSTKYKETFSAEIQDLKNLKPGKVYRWKVERENVTQYVDFTISEKNYVTILNHNYPKGSEKTLAKTINDFVKKDKTRKEGEESSKPVKAVIYELIPTEDVGAKKEQTTKKQEKKKTTEKKKAQEKKKKTKEEEEDEEEGGEEFDEFKETAEEFNINDLFPGNKTSTNPSTPTEKVTVLDPKDVQAFFKNLEEKEGEEDQASDEDFRKSVKPESEYKLENIEEAKNWLKSVLPQIEFKLANGLIHNKAWGMLKGSVITLSNLAEEGTIYHEAFEAVQKYILSPSEIRMLRREFRRREGTFIDYETGKTVKYSEASNYQIKEQLAEEYREYQLSNRTKKFEGQYRKRTFFEKLADFVDFIINYITGGSASINEVFEKLSNAQYKDKVINPFVKKINPEYRVATGENSLKNTDPKMFRRIMDSMTNLMFESISKTGKSIYDSIKYDLKSNEEYVNMRQKLKSFYNLTIYSKEKKGYKIIDLVKTITEDDFVKLMNDPEIAVMLFGKNYNTSFIRNLSNKMKELNYLPYSFDPTDTKKLYENSDLFYQALQRGGSKIMFSAISNYNYIDNNWEELVGEHKEFVAKYSIEFETEEEELEESMSIDENRTGPEYSPEITRVSRKQNASFEIKLLIATLKEMVYDYNKASKFSAEEIKTSRPKINELLLSNVVDYGKVVIDLLYKLSPATNIQEMFDIIQKAAETDAVMMALADRLKIGQTNLTEFDIDLRTKFYISMNGMLAKYSKLMIFPNSKMGDIKDVNELNDFSNIRENWINATVSNQSKIIRLNESTKKYEVKKEFKRQIKNIDDAFKFLNDLGYGFDFSINKLDASEKETVTKETIKLSNILFNTKNVEQLFQDHAVIRESLNELALVYMKHASRYAEPQHLNVEGEPVQNILLNNYIATIVKSFNISKSLENLINKIPQLNPNSSGNGFLSFSQILNPDSKFYKNGRLVKNLSVQIIEGTQVLEKNLSTPTDKLSLKDRVLQEFAYNLKGIYYILTPADAKTQWGINFGTFLTQNETNDNPQVLKIFKQYLKAEILAAQQDNVGNLELLNKTGNKLRFFQDILTFDLDLNGTPDQIIRNNEKQINEDILSFINSQTEKTYKYFSDNKLIVDFSENSDESGEVFTPIGQESFTPINSAGFTPVGEEVSTGKKIIIGVPSEFNKDGLTNQEIINLIRFNEINYMFNIFEQYKVLWGDPAQWKDPTKRIKSFTSGRNLSVNEDPAFNDFYNKKLNTLSYIDEEGNPVEVVLQPGDFGYVYYNDEMRTSTYNDVTVENSNLKNYDDINEPDAQGLVLPNGYREIKQRAGTWEEADQEQHEWDTALCRWEVTNGIRWEDRNKQNPEPLGIKENLYPVGQKGELLRKYDEQLLLRGNPYLNNSKSASLNNDPLKTAVTNVLKPIYSGLKKAFVNGLGIRNNYNSVVINLDKLSLAPMTWRLVRGRNSQEFFIEHFKKNTTYIKFESANKVGKTNDVEDLYNEKGEINLQRDKNGNVINIKHDVLDFKYFGIQVETKTQKNYSTLGTQVTKIITLNLNPEKRKDLIEKNSLYLGTLKEIAKKEIFKRFNIEEDVVNGEKVYRFKDYETIANFLQDALKKRDTPENLKNALKLDEDNNFYLKFDMMIGSERLESLITSIIDKEVQRPKMFGGQMPQIASTLFEKDKRFVKKIVNGKSVMTSGELLFYGDEYVEENGQTRRATEQEIKSGKSKTANFSEVYLPFFMKEYIEMGIELSINDVPEELRYGIGFRIPSQNTNSIENFRIKGFLPVEYGNSIVVPSEITKKAGSDFDIDKLNIYLYNYFIDDDGKPKKIALDTRPSFDENGNITEAAKERYDVLVRLRDPQANVIRKEYAEKIEEVKKKLRELRKRENEEIRSIKNQKISSELEIDELFIAKKALEKRVEDLQTELSDLKAIRKDFEKGFKQDYDSTKLMANIYGYPGDKISIMEKVYNDTVFVTNNIEETKLEIADLSERLKEISLTKYRKEQIEQKYEEKKKNEEYLLSLKKELMTKRNKEISEIVPSMSLEEFAKQPILMQNSKKAIENAYVDNIREILELPEMFEFLTKPNSAVPFKEQAKEINNLYGINKETKPSYYYLSRLNNAEDRHAFLIGKDAVGIAASHQTQHAISQVVGLSFSTKEKPKFYINFDCNYTVNAEDNSITYSFANVYDKAGNVISETISMFVDGAVDIAKDPYIFDLNANYNTYSIYLTAIRLGIPLNIVTRWYNQPVVREYIKLMQENNSLSTELNKEKKTKKELIAQAKNNVGALVDYPERNKDFDAEELDGYIKEYVQNKKDREEGKEGDTSLDFKQAQSMMLDQFLMMDDLSWDLFRFGQAINLDTSRTVSFESIRIKIARMNDALDGPFAPYVKKVINETFIGSIYRAKNELLDSIKPLYLTESDAARAILNPILQKIYLAGGKQQDVEDAARLLKRHFINYLLHALPIDYDNNGKPVILTDYINSLLLDSSKENAKNLTSAKLRRTQTKQKTGQLPENFLVDNLLGIIRGFVKTPGKIVNNIQPIRRMLDKTDVDLSIADFRNLDIDELANEGLAQELVKTALLQSGVITNPKSISQLIPNEIFQHIAVQVQNQFKDTSKIESILQNFENSYYQNLWYDRKIVPKASKTTTSGKPRISMDWLKSKTKEGKKSKSIPVLEYFVHSDSWQKDGKNPVFSIESRFPYLLYVSEKVDFDGVPKYSAREKAEMRKSGDFSFLEETLYKRLEIMRPDGKKDIPLGKKITRAGGKNEIPEYGYYIIYYPVPKYGEKFTSFEHYSKQRQSKINKEKIELLTDEKVYSSLEDNNKISDLFLFDDMFPKLEPSDEEFIDSVKKYLTYEEAKMNVERILGQEEETVEPVKKPTTQPTEVSEVEENIKKIEEAYNELTDEQKEKNGTLEEVINKFANNPIPMDINDYIDSLKC